MHHARRVLPKALLISFLTLVLAVTAMAQSDRGMPAEEFARMKAAGLLPIPLQVPAPAGNGLTDLQLSQASPEAFQLLIPLDPSFSVVPFEGAEDTILFRNDDRYTDTIGIRFTFRFFGVQHRTLYINNNGNISFDAPFSSYTSTGFPSDQYKMIAAFWADVDTRNDTSGVVYYKSEAHRFTIIWDRVGYYSSDADKLNTFEIIISDGTDPIVGTGNNVCFSYADMQWTTGSASGGTSGFYGTPATVGANRGDSANYALIGRFDHPGTDYDGPGGQPDGISYLDGRVFSFDISRGVGTLGGTVFRDDNSNGTQDPAEPGLSGWTIRLQPLNIYATTDSAGRYFLSFLPPNTYTVSEVLRPNWQQTYPATPGTYTVNIDSGQTRLGLVFGNRQTGGIQDLGVSLNAGRARRGSQKRYGIRYDNLGSAAVTGTVRLTLPSQVTHAQASAGGVHTSGVVQWNLGSIAPGATGWLWEIVNIPASVPLATILSSSVTIEPAAGDVRLWNNSDAESETVVGSFDPNEKEVSPAGEIELSDSLRYVIHFQNTGTDTALAVRLTDSLDTDLDAGTIEPGASSHPYTFLIVPPNQLVFEFAGINLPDSGHSRLGSQGFVSFQVKPRADALPGSTIANRAGIIFDQNQPVITNTVSNLIGGGFTIYPGDANNDGLVDVRDILPLGRFFGLTGTARTGGSLTWVGQALYVAWNPEEACYADCDGNGTVDGNDVQGIVTNWFRTHTGPPGQAVNRREVCEQLLASIDASGPLSPGMKEIRQAIVRYMQGELGIVFAYALEQNWPNPFNPSTAIRFSVAEQQAAVTLTIFNTIGQRVWERILTDVQPGTHEIQWMGESSEGRSAASGVYLYRLTAGGYTAVRRMILIK